MLQSPRPSGFTEQPFLDQLLKLVRFEALREEGYADVDIIRTLGVPTQRVTEPLVV